MTHKQVPAANFALVYVPRQFPGQTVLVGSYSGGVVVTLAARMARNGARKTYKGKCFMVDRRAEVVDLVAIFWPSVLFK
jgi:hypothetical protein